MRNTTCSAPYIAFCLVVSTVIVTTTIVTTSNFIIIITTTTAFTLHRFIPLSKKSLIPILHVLDGLIYDLFNLKVQLLLAKLDGIIEAW